LFSISSCAIEALCIKLWRAFYFVGKRLSLGKMGANKIKVHFIVFGVAIMAMILVMLLNNEPQAKQPERLGKIEIHEGHQYLFNKEGGEPVHLVNCQNKIHKTK